LAEYSTDTLLERLLALHQNRKYRSGDYFTPYPKQVDFFTFGVSKRERMLMGGNQLGKTQTGGFETRCHLTGEYPDWWPGRRFDHETHGWAASPTSMLTRDGCQRVLCGKPGVEELFGTGMIPKDAFVGSPTLSRGVANGYDTIFIRHKSGGLSSLQFKSYEQGKEKFQSATLDFVWLDEEPPMEVYSECLTRVTATGGMVYMTFTPLQGMSEVVVRYLDQPDIHRTYVVLRMCDAAHMTPELVEAALSGYPAHERETRANGVPMMGSGQVFTTLEVDVQIADFREIPLHWAKLWGIDFGINHPFAAALVAWDKDSDVIYLLHTIRMSGTSSLEHATAMLNYACDVPVAWPHDGNARDKGSGDVLAKTYRGHGLKMLPTHSTWPEGGFSVEAAVMDVNNRASVGKFRAQASLSDFFGEYRMYHRKDGVIVKIKDDIISALFKALMMKRFAKAVPLGGQRFRRQVRTGQVDGVDFDVFNP
jgi:phage terminase large subunit-like protein